VKEGGGPPLPIPNNGLAKSSSKDPGLDPNAIEFIPNSRRLITIVIDIVLGFKEHNSFSIKESLPNSFVNAGERPTVLSRNNTILTNLYDLKNRALNERPNCSQ